MNWLTTFDPEGQTSLRITEPSHAHLLGDVEARMQAGQGYSVATLNLDHVVKLRHDAQFRAAYQAQTHVTADGNPIVWLSRLAGQDISLVPGSELITPIIELAVKHQVPIAMFGATQDSLEATAKALKARYAGIQIAATLSPPMGFDPTGPAADDYIAQLDASGAGVCFLALGAPKQEVFAARAQKAVPRMGFLSIGAGLDFISGHQTRAPALVRRFALEWLWRMSLSPRRLFLRYMRCFAVLPGLILAALTARRQAKE